MGHRTRCCAGRGGDNLTYISPTSPLHLPYISARLLLLERLANLLAAALEAQYAEDPTTGDKLATLKAKATRACFDAGGLSAERMVRCRGDVGEI